MNNINTKPTVTPHTGDSLPIAGDALVDLLKEVLSRGAAFHLRAKGTSMQPFINDGDNITISPLGNVRLGIGRVIAYTRPESKSLVVHRIIDHSKDAFIIHGDNANKHTFDRVNKDAVLGYVIRVERDGRHIFWGLGPERYLIAWLSKAGLLTRIYGRLCRLM